MGGGGGCGAGWSWGGGVARSSAEEETEEGKGKEEGLGWRGGTWASFQSFSTLAFCPRQHAAERARVRMGAPKRG